MPTMKPRINVALSPESFSAVRRLSEAAGVSMSSIVAEHVEAVASVLVRTAQLIELGKRAQGERLGVVQAIVARAAEAIEPLQAQAADALGAHWDELSGVLEAPPEPPKAARGGAGAGPPPSNYGGQVSPKRGKGTGGRR